MTPSLTKDIVGHTTTTPPEGRAKQNCSEEEDQTEQCHILPEGSRLDTTLAVPVKKISEANRAEHCPAQAEGPCEENQAEQNQVEQNNKQAEPCTIKAADPCEENRAEHLCPPERMQDQPAVYEDRAELRLTDPGVVPDQAEHHDSHSSSSSSTLNIRGTGGTG